MSNTTVQVQTIQEPALSFLKKKHDLQNTLNRVQRASKEAIELLTTCMNDEKLDIRFRAQCAKDLIGMEVTMTDIISKDNMSRLIAEIKLNPGNVNNNLKTLPDKPSGVPALDFATISSV